MRLLSVTVVLLALAFCVPANAAGDEGAELKARTHFAAGEYKEALEIYARLYAETMHPTYLRNIARCHQNLGNADKAISSFREYLRKAHDLTPDQREEIEGYIAEMEQLKQSRAGAPTGPPAAAAAPPPPRRPATGRRASADARATAGGHCARSGRTTDGDGVGHDQRRRRPVLHARLVLGRGCRRRGGRRGHRGPGVARQRPDGRQPGSARPTMMRTVRWSGGLLVALMAIGSCGKDKTTALDIKLEITGAIDQVRIDTVSLDGSPVSLAGEMTTMFPAPPRMLKTGDGLTIWFADGEDMKMVVVTATGRLCGRDASAQATTPARALAKGQTVQTTLTLANNGTVCTGTGTGGAGAGGTGGAAGTGAGGASGAAGTGGSGGHGRQRRRQRGHGRQRWRRGRHDGLRGHRRRRGRTRRHHRFRRHRRRSRSRRHHRLRGHRRRSRTRRHHRVRGHQRRGRSRRHHRLRGHRRRTVGRLDGVEPADHRSGGTGMPCATAPIPGAAQPIQSFSQTAGCGYTGGFQTVDFVAAPNDYFAYGSGVAFGNSANCGRCVELVRNSTPAKRVTVTLVGSCTDPVCAANPNQARFQVSAIAYQLLAPMNETSLPLPGEMLTYSFVPCLVRFEPTDCRQHQDLGRRRGSRAVRPAALRNRGGDRRKRHDSPTVPNGAKQRRLLVPADRDDSSPERALSPDGREQRHGHVRGSDDRQHAGLRVGRTQFPMCP